MVKIFKKIIICFLVLLVTICSVPSVYLVKANNSENKTMNIVLPSNDMSIFTMYGNYDIYTIFAIEYAVLLFSPTTKFSNLYFRFKLVDCILVRCSIDVSWLCLFWGFCSPTLNFTPRLSRSFFIAATAFSSTSISKSTLCPVTSLRISFISPPIWH